MDRTHIYTDWAVKQCNLLNHNYFPAYKDNDAVRDSIIREEALIRRRNPDASPEFIRAELFKSELEHAIPTVMPEFDLCGRLTLDGKFRRTLTPADAVTADEVAACLALHPFRRFPYRWDHAAAETERFLAEGLDAIHNRLAQAPDNDFVRAMDTALSAFQAFIERHIPVAEAAGRTAMAAALRQIAHGPARTFYEAILLIHLRFVAWAWEFREAMALGRMDVHLLPYYQADLAAGRITRDQAVDLIQQFISLLAVGYINPVHDITISGRLPDGTDGTNEISYMILEAFRKQKLPGVNLFARFHAGTPAAFLDACADVIFTGGGMPALCNEDLSLQQLASYGVSPEDAFKHVFTGCAHLNLEGLQVPWTEGVWCIAPQVVNTILPALLEQPSFTFDDVKALVAEEIDHTVAYAVRDYNKKIASCSSTVVPDVFYSLFVDDCLTRGLEYNHGGARYKGVFGLDIYGLGLAADMLEVIRYEVIDRHNYTLKDLTEAAAANFEGLEVMRQQLLHEPPKFGNDNDEVDGIAAWFVDTVVACCQKHEPDMCDGSRLRPIFPGTLGYVLVGERTPATIDGRRAGEPLSDSGSPVAGRDTHGLTALMNSLGKIDHSGFTGMALNIRLNHRDFQGEEGRRRFRVILDVMRSKGIQELQFNCISTDELREAQAHPENHANLAIRVAGYSALFTLLRKNEQDSIIARHEN